MKKTRNKLPYFVRLEGLKFNVHQNLWYWYKRILDTDYMASDYNSALRYAMQAKYEKVLDKIHQLQNHNLLAQNH